MKKTGLAGLLLLALVMLALPASAADYVGSEQCFECHQDQFNSWQSTGHPWKLRTAEEASSAKVPL
ncbi:MAG TPA: hypothetical protein VKN62_01370, partial [Pelovirga sp.]|nr:hypothetical protein [Pelovirga sp.]